MRRGRSDPEAPHRASMLPTSVAELDSWIYRLAIFNWPTSSEEHAWSDEVHRLLIHAPSKGWPPGRVRDIRWVLRHYFEDA